MARTRDQIRNIRMAVLFGLIGGLLLCLGFRNVLAPGLGENHESAKHSVFFGSTEHWPQFMKGYLPLDLTVTCLSFFVVMYIMTSQFDKYDESFGGIARTVGGFFLMGGGFGGAIGAPMYGWYFGLEFFVLMGGAFIALALALGVLLGSVFGIGYFVYKGFQRIWPAVRQTAIGQLLIRFGRFMDAAEVPNGHNPG